MRNENPENYPMISVNGNDWRIYIDQISHREIACIADYSDYDGVSVTYKNGPPDNPEGILYPYKSVKVTNGMVFRAIRTGNS